METQTLELLICTLNEGIRRVPKMLLPPVGNVRYIVSWQLTGTIRLDLPEELSSREDVTVYQLEGRGLAANRNNALRNATADILLLSDDDARYTPQTLQRVLYNFRKYPKADFICFRAKDREGNPLKEYADEPWTYAKRPKNTYVSSIEIAFRRSANLPFFDERFGLGSKYLAMGEEEVFLQMAFERDMKIIYVPETIVETDGDTTGKRFLTLAAARRSKGAVLCFLYGPTSAAARSLKYVASLDVPAYRKWNYYKDMLAGIRYIIHDKL
ncbi:MAG: glycosyltransferase [Alloprevotella sp.]|nr:glycosyltransferase [Alloprevotella sp.]